jgi:hypothetical protein
MTAQNSPSRTDAPASSEPRMALLAAPMTSSRARPRDHESDDRDRSGDLSPALRAALAECGQEIADITAKIFEARLDSVTSRVSNVRDLVEQRLKHLAGLLNGEAPRTRGTGQTYHGNPRTPEREHYIASGSWDLLGRGRIDGAGGQNRTGYARLFRAALYH